MALRPERERRGIARVSFDAPVSAQPIPQPSSEHVRRLLAEDLSEGGIRLLSPNFFPVQTRVRLDLEPGRPAAPIRAIGRVVWVEQLREVDYWRVGVEFSDVSSGVRSRLHEIIAQQRPAP